MVSSPSRTLSLSTDRFAFALLDDDPLAAGWAELLLPRLEKFHFSPFCERTRLICGWLSVSLVTLSALEKISGISSTPTLSDFACTKALWLNAGSSAIEISSAFTAPENSESDKLPTFTGLPRASLNSDSSFGRKALASMNKGIRITIRIKTPTTMAAIFRLRFMRILRSTYPRLVGTMGWKVALFEHFIGLLNRSLLIFIDQY